MENKEESPKKKEEVLTKEKFDAQIKLLEDNLIYYESRRIKLQEECDKWETTYENEVKEKNDIIEHLERELKNELEKYNDLHQKLDILVTEHQPLKKVLEQEIVELEARYNSTKEKLTKEKVIISGQLAMLEEFRLKRSLVGLQAAEEKLMKENESYETQIRDYDKQRLLEREDLEEEFMLKSKELFKAFDNATAAELTGIIKNALQKCLDITEQMYKLSSAGVKIQERNFMLKENEKYFEFELKLDETAKNNISERIVKLQKTLKIMREKCEKQRRELTLTKEEITEFDMEEVKTLKMEVSKLRSKWLKTKCMKKKQEKYLNDINKRTENLRMKSLKLLTVLRSSEAIIKREINNLPEDCGVRNELLKQFMFLMNIPVEINNEKTELLKSVEEELTPSVATSLGCLERS